jgi:hypothetical protein
MAGGERGNEPTPNVLLMFAIAAGMWGVVYLLYVGVANVWRRASPTIAIERKHVPQFASLANRPQVERPARTRTKARQMGRKRQVLAYRVFGPSAPTY